MKPTRVYKHAHSLDTAWYVAAVVDSDPYFLNIFAFPVFDAGHPTVAGDFIDEGRTYSVKRKDLHLWSDITDELPSIIN